MKECAAGKFTDAPGAAVCKPCTAGYFCPLAGTSSSTIKQCEVNQHRSVYHLFLHVYHVATIELGNHEI